MAPVGVGLALLLLAACGSGSDETTFASDVPIVVATSISPSPTAELSTPTPVAEGTAAPSAATAQEDDPLASRLAGEAMAFLTQFTEDLSPRASGTAQERAAADFLVGQLESLGYEAWLQPFTVDVTESTVVIGPADKNSTAST